MMRFGTLLAVIALFGCGKDEAPPPAISAPAPTSQTPGRPAESVAAEAAPAAAAPESAPAPAARERKPPKGPPERDPVRDGPPPPPSAPVVFLTVNGQDHDPQVVPGWPVVVRLELTSPDGKPWRVSGGAASWSRLARLEMPGDAPWGFEMPLSAPSEVTVDERTSASIYWTIAPDASAKLARGERSLRAVLECKEGAGGAWTGLATSRELRVSVVDEPRPLPPAWAECKAETEIDYTFCREGTSAALARAEEATKAQPQSWRVLFAKGRLLAAAGRRAEALAAVDGALALWSQGNPDGCAPPWELASQRDALAWSAAEVLDAAPATDVAPAPPPQAPAAPAAPERAAAPPPAVPAPPAPGTPSTPEPKPVAVQVSGLLLTPPPAWTREDAGGVPAFRPATDPCRLYVLPARELQGTAKDTHDALVAAILAGNTPVGAGASGERHGFRWSAGRIRDARGMEAWFTLFTIERDGRLESVLFQADTREAYEANRRAVEAMIDDASLAPAAGEAVEEAGNVRFVRPAGWTREEREGAIWLRPSGLAPQRQCAVVIPPGEELAGGVREWFDKTWNEIAAGGKVAAGELDVRRGERFDVLVRSGTVEREGRSLVFTVVAFTPGTRVECVLFLADSRELFDLHVAAADRLVSGIGFKNLDVARGKTRIEGAWMRRAFVFNVTTRTKDPQDDYVFFYEGGLACRAWSAAGQDGIDPAREMAIADPKYGEWGRRTETGGTVTVRWTNGGESAFVRGEEGTLREGTSAPYHAMPSVDGLVLDGLYRYGDGKPMQGVVQFEIRFTPDGRFEETDFCGCVQREGPRRGAGKYRIASYTLHLEYDGGQRVRMGFFVLGEPGRTVEPIYANTFAFSRAR
ncbi:MAG TPA: hypothetical protein VFY93_01760, partial [Planctomycetota bacterium]|nr:hypothetical protein [Planctomycetota bacterium]